MEIIKYSTDSTDFEEKIKELTEALNKKRVENSNKTTPPDRVAKKGTTGYDIVEEDYMRAELDRQFIWSYVPMTTETIYMKTSHNSIEYQVPYAEKTLGYLEIIDNGIIRKFPAPGYQQYQFRKDCPKTPDNLLNPELTIRGATSRGLAFAINRLTRIADDIYRKKAEEYQLDPKLVHKLETYLANGGESHRIDLDTYKKSLEVLKSYDNKINNLPEHIAINMINFIKNKIGETNE